MKLNFKYEPPPKTQVVYLTRNTYQIMGYRNFLRLQRNLAFLYFGATIGTVLM